MALFFKYVGALLGLLPILIILYGWIISALGDVFPFLLGMVVINLLFLVILPRILKNPVLHAIQEGGLFFIKGLNRTIVSLVLLIVYLVGVGMVFFLSRIAGKKFLSLKPTSSTWVAVEKKEIDYQEM